MDRLYLPNKEIFLNVFILLKIMAIMIVSTTAVEWLILILKYIKHYL